jgi:hypothetical protein
MKTWRTHKSVIDIDDLDGIAGAFGQEALTAQTAVKPEGPVQSPTGPAIGATLTAAGAALKRAPLRSLQVPAPAMPSTGLTPTPGATEIEGEPWYMNKILWGVGAVALLGGGYLIMRHRAA